MSEDVCGRESANWREDLYPLFTHALPNILGHSYSHMLLQLPQATQQEKCFGGRSLSLAFSRLDCGPVDVRSLRRSSLDESS